MKKLIGYFFKGLLVLVPIAVSVLAIGRDECGKYDDSCIGKKVRHLSDSSDVLLAVLRGKPEILVEPVAYVVTVQYIGIAAPFKKPSLRQMRQGRFP